MSRLDVIAIAAIVAKFILLMWLGHIRRKHNDSSTTYTFAYCDGSIRHVVSREIVDRASFMNYDLMVSYPVLHISRDTIYFDIVD